MLTIVGLLFTHRKSEIQPRKRSPHLSVLAREEALLKATVHGERDEDEEPAVSEQAERGQEGAAEWIPVPTELPGLTLVNVVQKHSHDDHGQQPDS